MRGKLETLRGAHLVPETGEQPGGDASWMAFAEELGASYGERSRGSFACPCLLGAALAWPVVSERAKRLQDQGPTG